MEKAQFDRYNKIDPDADVRAIFDQTNPNWSNTQEYNHQFVRYVMNSMHHTLLTRSYLFVNDVLDRLGIPAIPEGQLLGWRSFGMKEMDFSFTSDSEGGAIVLKNAQFIWHTL